MVTRANASVVFTYEPLPENKMSCRNKFLLRTSSSKLCLGCLYFLKALYLEFTSKCSSLYHNLLENKNCIFFFLTTLHFLYNSLGAWCAEKMFRSGTASGLKESVCGKLRLLLSFLVSRSSKARGNENFIRLDP